MKLKKPEDEKYFKDVVLNSILQEISQEQGIATPTKRTTNKQKIAWGKLFFYLALGVVVMAVGFVFYLVSVATQKEVSPTPSATHTEIVVTPNTPPIQPPKSQTTIPTPQKPNPKPLSKEEREALMRLEAKKALLEQMKR